MPNLPKIARHDPSICGARGLFRSIKRGSRATPLKLTQKYGGELLRFRSSVLLGCDDLAVLQAIMTLATSSNRAIRVDSPNKQSRELRSKLALGGDVKTASALLVETSFSNLALVAGYADRGGAMVQHLRNSLGRLSNCRVVRVSPSSKSKYRLISWDENGNGRDRLRIALNPRSSRCAHGCERYTLIRMDEARGLKDDVSRLCHQRLSTWIDADPKQETAAEPKQQRVRIAKLWDYAWSDTPDALSAAAVRQRRASLRATIADLRSIGWRIEYVDVRAGLYEIGRPTKLRHTSTETPRFLTPNPEQCSSQ